MHRLFPLVLLLVALPATAQPVPADTFRARAVRLSAAFFSGDDAAASIHFDEAMRAALTAEQSAAIRQQLGAQMGPLVGRGVQRLVEEGGYCRVHTWHNFARTSLDVHVFFHAHGRVSGLFFRPALPETTVPYADTSAFRERPFRLTRPDAPGLDGTLAVPARPTGLVPMVLLVHGSGPPDRDGTVGGTKAFRDLR